MPYASDTLVPASLLRILDQRIGRPRAARLLHDHLDNPDDVVTEANLACALGGLLDVKRGLGKRTVDGYDAVNEVTFDVMIGGIAWNGGQLKVPAMPETIRMGLTGARLNEVVGSPLLGDETILRAEIDEQDETVMRLTVEQPMLRMRDIRPALPFRMFAARRRAFRWMRMSHRIGAQMGFRLWVPFAALVGCLVGLIVTELAFLAVLAPEMGLLRADAIATPAALCAMPIGYVLMWAALVRMVSKEDVVRKHAEATIVAAARDGL